MRKVTCWLFSILFFTHLAEISAQEAASNGKMWCDMEIDSLGCLNINCNSVKRIKHLPGSLEDLVANFSVEALFESHPNVLLCSIDLTETGVTYVKSDTFYNIDMMLLELIRHNANQSLSSIKLLLSHIDEIREFKLPNYLNTVLFIRDSIIQYVQPKALSLNLKLELNMIGVNMTSINWFHLLDSAKLKLLSLRSIPNMKDEFNSLHRDFLIYPIATIHDVKIYNTYLPIIDDNFLLFKVLKFIEQLELNGCSISFIKNSIFEKYSTSFRNLKYLSLMNNNLNKISDQTFSGLMNLVSLDLDDNPIEFIQPNTFVGLKKLKTLSVNSNTLKSLTVFNSNPAWIFSTIRGNKNLIKLSFKTNQLLKNTCLIKTIIETIQAINKNIVQSASNRSSKAQVNSSAPPKRIIELFVPDQLGFNYEQQTNLNDVNCNAYLVCQLTKSQNEISESNLWFIEVFKSCPLILMEKSHQKCLIEKMIQECDHSKSKHTLENKAKKQMGNSSPSSICDVIVGFLLRFKWVFITTSCLVVFILALVLISAICYCVKKRRKENQRQHANATRMFYDSPEMDRKQIHKSPRSRNEFKRGDFSLDQPNDFYVVLVEKS